MNIRAHFLAASLALLACTSASPAGPSYVAKKQSVFDITEPTRNPFWPIGFVPVKRVANQPVEEQLLRIPVENYRVTTIVGGNPAFAVINGKDYTTGQFLTINTPTGTSKLLISKIEDGYVVVQYKALVAKIPISRK